MASRSIARPFTEPPCPKTVDYGFSHGTSPTVCSLRFPGEISVTAGQKFFVKLDNSLWAGYVISAKYNTNTDETVIQSVDWRDRLHDVHVFAQFNMKETDGRFFHILPGVVSTNPDGTVAAIAEGDWPTQRRTYNSKDARSAGLL